MKHLSILILSIVLLACSGEQKQEGNKNINEVINELEELHPYNLSPDKSWMIDLNYENELLKSYTIIHQGGEELTTQIDSPHNYTIIKKPKSVDYSWVQDKVHGNGFKISSIGFTKNGEVSLLILNDGVGIYTENAKEGIN